MSRRRSLFGAALVAALMLGGVSYVAFGAQGFNVIPFQNGGNIPANEKTLSTITLSGTHTFYSISITQLNGSISVAPGAPTTAYFDVSSPIQGTFYFAVAESGSVVSPGLIVQGASIALPGVTATIPTAHVVSGGSHVTVPVTISATSSVQTPFTLTLYVFQHQSDQPGNYMSGELAFNVNRG